MLIVVAMRCTDAHASVRPLSGEVHADPRMAGPSPADHAALESGLRLAERTGGRCVVVTQAPVAAEEVLREALSCGANEVLRVDSGAEPDERAADSGAGTAKSLAEAIRARFGIPDVLLTGDHSIDRGTGATPAFLASEMRCAQALGLVSLETTGTDEGGRLRGVRRLDRGRRERLAIPLPAVCSVEPAGVRLRTATLPATLAARSAEIPVHQVAAEPAALRVRAASGYRPRAKELPPPAGSEARQRVLELTGAHEQREPPRIVTTDDPAEAAEELVSFLRDKGYLDG